MALVLLTVLPNTDRISTSNVSQRKGHTSWLSASWHYVSHFLMIFDSKYTTGSLPLAKTHELAHNPESKLLNGDAGSWFIMFSHSFAGMMCGTSWDTRVCILKFCIRSHPRTQQMCSWNKYIFSSGKMHCQVSDWVDAKWCAYRR